MHHQPIEQGKFQKLKLKTHGCVVLTKRTYAVLHDGVWHWDGQHGKRSDFSDIDIFISNGHISIESECHLFQAHTPYAKWIFAPYGLSPCLTHFSPVSGSWYNRFVGATDWSKIVRLPAQNNSIHFRHRRNGVPLDSLEAKKKFGFPRRALLCACLMH